MSLIKLLILSNALDPVLSFDAIREAFRTVDAEERRRDADPDGPWRDPWEPDDEGVQNLRVAFWA